MQKILFLKNELANLKVYNKFFLRKKEFFTYQEILELANINIEDLITQIDKDKKFYSIRTLMDASENDISFFTNAKYKEELKNTKAGLCILEEEYKKYLPLQTIPVCVKNPHYFYTILLDLMFQVPSFIIEPGISQRANIDASAKIGENCEIQAGTFIGKNVVIGSNCKICANAVINDNCVIDNNVYLGNNTVISYAEIGQNTIIHNNTSIGQCGFGFAFEKGVIYKIPQLGIVRIGNFVEIGAGVCIDRGAATDTVIGDFTKLDNLIQIAHGVKVGKGCFLAGCCAVAGSAEVGNYVQIGGHASVLGHIKIADGTKIAGNSGVAKDTTPMMSIGGYPAINLRDWHRLNIKLHNLLKKE